jgi:AraC-like DNA-binding protein
MTPGAYLTNLRLASAKHHLVVGTSVADAAERAGFADPYYFSRVFTREVGCTPSAYARTAIQAVRSEQA